MIYSVGLKLATPDVDNSSSMSELTEEKSYAVTEFSSQRLSALEPSPSLGKVDDEQLAVRILQRIEARLPCRIRKLRVLVAENAVVLEGQCSTYYSVLEYERLTNHIEVCSAK